MPVAIQILRHPLLFDQTIVPTTTICFVFFSSESKKEDSAVNHFFQSVIQSRIKISIVAL